MIIKHLLAHKYIIALVFLYTSAITWLSLAKFILPEPIRVEGSDKLGHFLAYFLFGCIWFSLFFFSEKLSKTFTYSVTIASVIGIAYGALMEILQGVLTDYRSPDWYDIAANTTGIILAALFLNLIKKKLTKLRTE
ncbi:VanZ family protein [Aquimarina sp. TRL1]|uniref:VanZ family protein n=1 Tax=Aquimarina sp. (strain TRL1) TaxID=2736252 RepID=UPI00158EAFCE|nr:VanZ family protein [Aquimarina sp. TRL1]QKX05155.1 VanZ family protein [Aquimarina sp. TRL1]